MITDALWVSAVILNCAQHNLRSTNTTSDMQASICTVRYVRSTAEFSRRKLLVCVESDSAARCVLHASCRRPISGRRWTELVA